MKFLRALTGGLIGAIFLTVLQEALKKNYENAPRMDLLGEEAIEKGFDKIGIDQPDHEKIQTMALAGDIIFNALLFSAAATTISACSKGTLLGIAAGVGSLYLPEKMGLNPLFNNKTIQTKILTVSMYTLGGFVAGRVMDRLKRS